MQNVIVCPHCGEKFEMDTAEIPVGVPVECPKCGHEFVVEEAGEFTS